MQLIELSNNEYYDYVNNSKNKSIYQSIEYARFLNENGFDYNFLGIKDNFNNIIAASLIAYKKCYNNYYFGYAPGGIFIDYSDTELIIDFTKALKKYYKKMIFIKIIPNIIIGKLNKNTQEFKRNDNEIFIKYLNNAKIQELKNNQYFESILPKYRPIVNLKTFSYNNLHKNVRNKIRKAYKKGLSIEKVSYDKLNELYPFIKNKSKQSLSYYETLFHCFDATNKVDIFLVSINFEEYLINMKEDYQKELTNNNILIKKVKENPTNKILDTKMQSDKELLNIKNNIIIATQGLSRNKKQYIAGAIVVKDKDKVIIFESGYDKKFKDSNPNYYLNYKLIEYYKYNYNELDMNGFTGDLTKANPYYGVNEFKLGFNCDVYETIGEFDIILNKRLYNKLSSNGTLSKLFKK